MCHSCFSFFPHSPLATELDVMSSARKAPLRKIHKKRFVGRFSNQFTPHANTVCAISDNAQFEMSKKSTLSEISENICACRTALHLAVSIYGALMWFVPRIHGNHRQIRWFL